MTDLLSRVTTYYSGFQYNSKADSVDCYINNQLLYPLVQKADDFQIGLSKMKINLSSVPIGGQATNIIPLKSWQITINETINGQLLSGSAFVRQINAKLGNFLFDASSQADAQIKQYSYNNVTGTTTLIKTLTLIPYIVQMFIDDYGNIYCSCADNLNGNANKFRVFDTEGQILIDQDYDVIKCITIDINQTVFIATDTKVDVYTNVNSLNNVALTYLSSITTNFAGQPLTNIATVASDGLVIVGYNQNDITLYNDGLVAQADYQEPLISQIGKASQIISSARRFCLTDDNIIAESFVGVASGASTSMVNMVDNTTWVTGSWNSLSKMALIVNPQNPEGIAYGIGDGDLATYKYQPCLQPTGTPSNINAQQNSNCVELNGHLITNGYNLTNDTLYGLGLDNLNTNTYFEFQTDFSPNVGVVIAKNFDIQNNNGKVIYCGNDNNLYRSSTGLFPKQCWIDGPPTQGANSTFFQVGSGWNTKLQTQTASLITTAINGGASPINWGAYKSVDGYCYLLNTQGVPPPSPQSIVINKLSLPDYSVVYSAEITTQGNASPFTNIQMTPLSTGYYAIMVDFQAGDQVFIFDEVLNGVTPVLMASFVPPVRIAYNAPIQARFIGYSNYLAIVSGTQIFTYDVTNPAAPTLIANINNPIGATLNQYSITACNNYIYTISQSAVDVGQYAICQLTPNGGWSAITSSLEIDQYGITAFNPNRQRNSLSSNEILDEISFLSRDSFILVYKGSAVKSLTSQVQLPLGTSSSIGNFFYVFGNINNSYSLNLVTTAPSATAIDCVACSKSTPNTIYVIKNSDKLVYKAVYNPATNTLGNIVADINITGTWASINTVLNPVDNGLVYNFSTTDQSAQGTYVAGNKVLSIARNAVTNEFLVSKSVAPNLVSLNANNFTQNFITTLPIGSMWSKNSDDLDSGPFSVYSYEPVIAAINTAFLEAYTRLQNLGGTYSSAPQISYDYNQGYLTLSYPALLTEINQGNSLVFSETLLQYAYFNNLNGTLILPLNSQSLTQTVRSMVLLNTLNALVLVSDTIFVSNSFQGNNVQNRNIATIDVPVDQFYAGNYGQTLYFQPTFYRPYRLASNGPIVNLTFRLNYETQDGNQYIVQLPPNTSWTFIAGFIKKD